MRVYVDQIDCFRVSKVCAKISIVTGENLTYRFHSRCYTFDLLIISLAQLFPSIGFSLIIDGAESLRATLAFTSDRITRLPDTSCAIADNLILWVCIGLSDFSTLLHVSLRSTLYPLSFMLNSHDTILLRFSDFTWKSCSCPITTDKSKSCSDSNGPTVQLSSIFLPINRCIMRFEYERESLNAQILILLLVSGLFQTVSQITTEGETTT